MNLKNIGIQRQYDFPGIAARLDIDSNIYKNAVNYTNMLELAEFAQEKQKLA